MAESVPGPAPWERQRPGLGTRLFRLGTGAVFLSVLSVATVSWVELSKPFDPGQRAALPIRLDPATAQAATRLPTSPGSVVALTYHGVADDDHAGSTLSRRTFGEHMAALNAAGYRTVRLADVEKLLTGRPVRLPPKALLLTFDDGRLTDWTTVDPVLKAHRFTAVGFLTTGDIVTPGTPSYYLSTRQVRALKATGRWEFGSHSHDRDTWLKAADAVAVTATDRFTVRGRMVREGGRGITFQRARIRGDLARSRRFFRDTLGFDVRAFSYPYGEARGEGDTPYGQTGGDGKAPQLDREMPTLVRAAGFGMAFVGERAPAGHVDAITARSPRWLLDRIGIRSTTSAADLLKLIGAATPVAPPRDLTTLSWTGDSARCERRSQDLIVSGDGYGVCLLSGINTSGWTDYRVSTTISGITPRATAIIAVRDDAGTRHRGRVEVVVGVTRVLIRQQVRDGRPRVLARAPIPRGIWPRPVEITADRDRVSVRIASGRPLSAAIDPYLGEGGFQFKIAAQGRHALDYRRPAVTLIRTN